MKLTSDVYKELAGLYVNQLVSNKYDLNDHERENIREKNAQFAARLDALGVPWKIQNAIAAAGERRENWGRYNRDVIREVIARRGSQNND